MKKYAEGAKFVRSKRVVFGPELKKSEWEYNCEWLGLVVQWFPSGLGVFGYLLFTT